MTLTDGSKLGAYEVLALIGSGGMGEVYRARDSQTSAAPQIIVVQNWFDELRRLVPSN